MGDYYVYSFTDGDTLEGYFGTEDDAFDAAVSVSAEFQRRPFLISMLHAAKLRWSTTAEDIIREIEENLDDEIGDVGAFDIATDADELELDKRLEACISGWIKDRKISSGHDLISWTKEFVYNPETMEYERNYGYME